MFRIQLLQIRQLTLQTDPTGKVGVEYHQGAFIDMFVQVSNQCRIVRLVKCRLLGIERFQQHLHVSWLPWSWHKGIEIAAERHQSGFVLFVHGHIRQHQRRIDAIVQQRHAVKCLLHHPALIYHAVYLLRTLILIDIHHQFRTPCRCFPVNSAEIIACNVIFDLFKIGMMPHTSYAFDAHLCQVIRDSQQFILM